MVFHIGFVDSVFSGFWSDFFIEKCTLPDVLYWRLPCPNRGPRPLNYIDVIGRDTEAEIVDLPNLMRAIKHRRRDVRHGISVATAKWWWWYWNKATSPSHSTCWKRTSNKTNKIATEQRLCAVQWWRGFAEFPWHKDHRNKQMFHIPRNDLEISSTDKPKCSPE